MNGEAAARTFVARGRRVQLWDIDRARTEAVAERSRSRGRARPRRSARGRSARHGHTRAGTSCWTKGSLRPGQHASLMGADGPGKAEIAVEELARVRVFCDDWEQASHNGELVHAVEAGRLERKDVTELGDVLAGDGRGTAQTDEASPSSTRPVSRSRTWRLRSPPWSRRLRWTYGRSSSSSRVRSEHRGGVELSAPARAREAAAPGGAAADRTVRAHTADTRARSSPSCAPRSRRTG